MKKIYPILLKLITLFLYIVVTSCSTTTHFSLMDNNRYYMGKQIKEAKKSEDVGVEVSLLLKSGDEINGELLYVRDSNMILCSEYAAKEEELTERIYPISIISNKDIQQLTIVGSSWIWEGIAAGAFVGGLTGMLIASEGLEVMAGLVFGTWIGLTAGWITGYVLSTEEYVLQEIPDDYNWSILIPLSRYQDKEPEYLQAIE